ncbi:acyl-CoA dehydrogenase family protein [Actinoallomurus rhizosphaericola]|uniref:acyl-CoA dehydrogenase family protein n=1 Tax=Actinoallomurus rhizosphaericola TaxID=2952536 RepID=UPI0020902045|nr:acyl-CoA dehydrogenase family protein [Actinoallomurus rhizosphaericola]MCO5991841.1 acyl-CoA/acyl-ACP dehydrogenase [Actinoallomurus rhizosphaericola]
MDFDLDESARELQDLAAGLLDREATPERLEAHERSGAPYDAALWRAMAQAGLLGACLPEEVGGAGLGAVELAVILRQVGAHVAPVPAYGSLVAAATVAAHGTVEQRGRLADLAAGGSVLSVAVREPGSGLATAAAREPGTGPATAAPHQPGHGPARVPREPGAGLATAAPHQPGAGPATTARRDGDAYVLDGVKTFVPYAEQADVILVPAWLGEETGVFLVEPGAVALAPQPSATGEPLWRIGLDGVRVGADALLGGGAHRTLTEYATAGAVAIVSGALDRALALTTEHVKTREQFERPLAEFQAVTMQIGDVYIAKRALDVAVWAGVWRLAEGLDDAAEVLAVAAYNACDPALRAFYTCQHLHGGLGLDVTYPLHRYFAWAKHQAELLGGAEAQLDAIGALVA